MADYNQVGNYVLFEEKNPDSIGKNFRAGELVDNKIKNHCILSEVNSLLYSNPKVWKRITILLEGIKKSNITGLYSPDKILSMGEKQMLIFPFKELVSFDSILEDSASKGIPINFDLAFSIATAISDLLDIGSTIVISGQKSFHGFLTPDNILIDFEGKIYLKNYGICPYLDKDPEVFPGLEKQYGSWITPEFHRREKIVPQSDVYHLGYLLFKMLTGKYFSFNLGEDFDSKLENISFSQHIHESNKDFISGLQEFFKKTLHPDPSMRFANSKEFKEFISKKFNIEELSSVTFNLAYFMDSLYPNGKTEIQSKVEKEKLYTPPERSKSSPGKVDTELVETILSGLEEREKGGKPKFYMMIASIIIVIIAISAYFFVQSNKSKQEKIMKAEQIRLKMEQKQREQSLLAQLKAVEDRAAKTEEEKKLQEEEKLKLQSQIDDVQKEKERIRKIEEEKKRKADEEAQLKKDAEEKKKKADADEKFRKAENEKKRLADIERKKKELEALKPKKGEVLPLNAVDKKPVRISGKNPVFPPIIRRKYAGTRFEARITCLVDENGIVKSSRVLNTIPKDIKKAIEKAMMKWKFSPAEKMGVKVSVWKRINIKISI